MIHIGTYQADSAIVTQQIVNKYGHVQDGNRLVMIHVTRIISMAGRCAITVDNIKRDDIIALGDIAEA